MRYLILLLFLNGCFGPTLFNVGTYNVTVGDFVPKTTLITKNKEKN